MSSFISYLYSITYSIVIISAIITGISALDAGFPIILRIVFTLIGLSALVQIVLDTQGYRVSRITGQTTM